MHAEIIVQLFNNNQRQMKKKSMKNEQRSV